MFYGSAIFAKTDSIQCDLYKACAATRTLIKFAEF